MNAHEFLLIRVQSEWDGWRSAEVLLADLQAVHWFQPDRAPHPLVHGYISCSAIVNGSIPHQCDPLSAPHRLRVCVIRRHTIPSVYAELARRADAQRVLSGPPASAVHRATPAIGFRSKPVGRRQRAS